jgi:hypothetical protein
MALPDQAADRVEAAGVEGGAQPLYLFGISLEFSLGADKIGHADSTRRVGVAAPFDPERRAAVAVPAAAIRPLGARHTEREDEPAARRQAFDPAIGRPRHGKTDVNPVGRGFRPRAPSSQMTRTFGRPERALARLASAASNSTAVTWPAGSTSSARIAL